MSRDKTYLQHMLDAIEKIEGYATAGYDEFMAKSHWHDALMEKK